jgi:hypothetical protein
MTRADDGGRLLRFLVADGPLPSNAGRQAWVQNGWPANDERLLTAALRKAGIERVHHGYPGVAQRWWWKAPGDTRPIGGDIKPYECIVCRQLLELPAPRLCISTPRCPGAYKPTPWPTPPPKPRQDHIVSLQCKSISLRGNHVLHRSEQHR